MANDYRFTDHKNRISLISNGLEKDIAVLSDGSHSAFVSMQNAKKLWPILKRFAETGSVAEFECSPHGCKCKECELIPEEMRSEPVAEESRSRYLLRDSEKMMRSIAGELPENRERANVLPLAEKIRGYLLEIDEVAANNSSEPVAASEGQESAPEQLSQDDLMKVGKGAWKSGSVYKVQANDFESYAPPETVPCNLFAGQYQGMPVPPYQVQGEPINSSNPFHCQGKISDALFWQDRCAKAETDCAALRLQVAGLEAAVAASPEEQAVCEEVDKTSLLVDDALDALDALRKARSDAYKARRKAEQFESGPERAKSENEALRKQASRLMQAASRAVCGLINP